MGLTVKLVKEYPGKIIWKDYERARKDLYKQKASKQTSIHLKESRKLSSTFLHTNKRWCSVWRENQKAKNKKIKKTKAKIEN